MPQQKAWISAALFSLIVIELWAFSGSFQKYFNLDSAFYVIHSPKNAAELRRAFVEPDVGRQYRPLTLSFMALFVPVFGLNPYPYHWIPIVFHIVNTILLYALARRLLNGSLAALAATAFWGVHSVVGWVTYDTTCISDFMLAFLMLSSLILAVEGSLRNSRMRIVGSILLYALALLTKESAVMIPLALLICLILAQIRTEAKAPGSPEFWRAFRKALPLAGIFLVMAMAYAGLLLHWFRAGLLYAQGSGAAYNIDPWTNALSKSKYLYWALNLPDALHIPDATRVRLLSFGLMGVLFACLLVDVLRRRGRLEAAAWAGLVWLFGMNVPALMLSSRLAKWYLYIPLLGLAMTVGTLVQSFRERMGEMKRQVAVPAVFALCVVPTLFSSVVQTRSYLSFSDASYASEVLDSFLGQLRGNFPADPKRATFFVLPTFEPEIAKILSSPPVDTGRLVELQHPGSKVKMLFAHRGDRLSSDLLHSPDTRIFQNLHGRFFDVTRYYRPKGKMTLFVLPTPEGKIPPLLRKEPIGGPELYRSHVTIAFADEGARLPEDYASREDLWILQYIEGHFTDVTDYYKDRRGRQALHLFRDLRQIQTTVSRDEYYPSYDRFNTPNGEPAFFPTPEREILTQIGGSTVVLPLGTIPPGAKLCFDVSWMFDLGDGAWAEMRLKTERGETAIFRQYMGPNRRGEGLSWKPMEVDLTGYAGQHGELTLRCTNDRGKTTIADWLNWRDIAIETRPGLSARSK